LEVAMTDLEKLQNLARSMEKFQQNLQKLGRDLAEQLQNGQAEAARGTLDKLASQLRAADLPPGALEKILTEVSRAIQPAAPYGKVAEHLSSGAKQMQAGARAAAADSLTAAARELEKLMQQMADAQALMSELAALNQAAMCIGMGQGWRPGNKPGLGGGKQPGSGVGTWADEGGNWDGQLNDAWDNSGITRPDMAGRGLSDRPDGLSNALKPTKVPGQFSPGGQMPSVSLKGVSLKGQSTVDYREAVSAAQSEAQSALNQDKVPQAYREAVREYFSDLNR
jgi:hypothetical protein